MSRFSLVHIRASALKRENIVRAIMAHRNTCIVCFRRKPCEDLAALQAERARREARA
jgi:hypothetical protein